jgi:hypothetical protein
MSFQGRSNAEFVIILLSAGSRSAGHIGDVVSNVLIVAFPCRSHGGTNVFLVLESIIVKSALDGFGIVLILSDIG